MSKHLSNGVVAAGLRAADQAVFWDAIWQIIWKNVSIILRCILNIGLVVLIKAARRFLEHWRHHGVFTAGEDVDWLVLQVRQICNTTSLVLNQCALNRLMPVVLHIL